MNPRFAVFTLLAASVALLPVAASAQSPSDPIAEPAPAPTMSVVRAQFTDKVEDRKPVGDEHAAASANVVTYWVEVSNPGETTEITLVWTADGTEIARQKLDVGRAPHWRTWGMVHARPSHALEVQVLDASGAVLRTDTLSRSGL